MHTCEFDSLLCCFPWLTTRRIYQVGQKTKRMCHYGLHLPSSAPMTQRQRLPHQQANDYTERKGNDNQGKDLGIKHATSHKNRQTEDPHPELFSAPGLSLLGCPTCRGWDVRSGRVNQNPGCLARAMSATTRSTSGALSRALIVGRLCGVFLIRLTRARRV